MVNFAVGIEAAWFSIMRLFKVNNLILSGQFHITTKPINLFFMQKTIKYILLVAAAILLTPSVAQDRREVSLLTCSPGEEVYAHFGHTALRVNDPTRGADVVFSYGIFSFDEPNFVWRFILGKTDYLLGAIDYPYFIAEYSERGSGVNEQVLALDSLQKNAIIAALIENIQPQNRVYRYNFLYNNCTTKARDKIFEAIGSGIGYSAPSAGDSLTFRDIVHHFTGKHPWYQLGMDMLLGAPADETATRSGAQFAPIIFMQELSTATADGKPLLKEERELTAPQEKQAVRNNLTPFNVSLLVLLFTLIIMLCERRTKKSYLLWDALLMTLQGAAGIVLTIMVLLSQHPTVNENWLLIWLNPLPLVLLPILIYKVIKKQKATIMWIQVAMVTGFIVASPFLPQYIPAALYPCAVALIARSLFHIYKDKICALDSL